ncbi:MAG: DMT family transporter [Thermohalobaculum sp.]|nr:DMT family transporter [Thermohalobaculum sp.]
MAAAPTDNRRGALLLVAAAAVFTAEVVVVRLIGERAGSAQIVAARAVVQLVAVAAIILARNPRLFVTARPGMHLLRGLTSLVCWWLYYRSFQSLDMALATVLTFTTSLFVVALAAPLLGEAVGARRWAMTALGFAGVVLASGARGLDVEPGLLFGLGAAVSGAALVFQNRVLARTEATLTIMVYIALIATLGTAPVAALDWQPLGGATLALVALGGGLGTLGMFLTIEAYRTGEVSALAPFPYTRLVFAVAAGAVLFGEVPTPATLAGGALIIGCALAVSRHERRRGLRAPGH